MASTNFSKHSEIQSGVELLEQLRDEIDASQSSSPAPVSSKKVWLPLLILCIVFAAGCVVSWILLYQSKQESAELSAALQAQQQQMESQQTRLKNLEENNQTAVHNYMIARSAVTSYTDAVFTYEQDSYYHEDPDCAWRGSNTVEQIYSFTTGPSTNHRFELEEFGAGFLQKYYRPCSHCCKTNIVSTFKEWAMERKNNGS